MQKQSIFSLPGWTFGLCLALCMTILSPLSAKAEINAIGGAPEGFEVLEKPRAVSITLYYGGDAIGTAQAQAAPGTVLFDSPDAVMDFIPTISDRNVVGAALAKPLPMNLDKACTEMKTENCGTITPDVLGMIYDDDTMSAELFINKNYLSVAANEQPRYLPLPERSLASIYGLTGAVSGSQGQAPNFTLSNVSVYSYGEMKLATQSTLTDNGVRIDKLAAGVDRNGWNATAGLFRSASMQLLSDRDIAGVSYSTSMKTRLDNRKTEGNQVILYLARRSFVSIYREGRLYSSRAYDAGNQEIDTSELPDGAYNITLKIQEADGTSREETRFYAKSQDIPSAGNPTYYVQAGMLREPAQSDDTIPNISSHPIVRAGTARRVRDNLGVGVDVLGTQDRVAVEGKAFWMMPNAQAQFTTLGSTKGDTGVQFAYMKTTERMNIALDARKTWMSDTPMKGFEDLSRDVTQGTATIGYTLNAKTTIGARASYVKDADMPASSSLGPYAEWRIWQKGESMLTANANAARTQGENDASFIVNFSHKFGNYGVSSSTGVASQGGPLGNARVWHDHTTADNTVLLGAGVSGDKNSQTLSADGDWKNNIGQVRGSVQHASGASGNGLSYGGNFAVNALQKGGEVHVGGDQTDRSAVIVETTGSVDEDMLIMVNNVERSTVHVGNKRVIYLTPFHSYNIRIKPKNEAFLDYESGNRRVTLYPGNVVKETWDVNRFYVVIASILDADGMTLVNANVKDTKELTATDEGGHLQVETSDTKAITLEKDGKSCVVSLPSVQDQNGVLMYSEPLVCR